MTRRAITTTLAPAPTGAYAQGIAVEDILYLAGQGPFDPSGRRVGTSLAEQLAQVVKNLEAVAQAAGGSLTNAVRVGVYLRDLADFDDMDAAYRELFPEPRPARTTIETRLPGFDVEMDAVVWLGG